MVSRPMSTYQAWYLTVQNAIDNDQPIPLPPGKWELAPQQYRDWSAYIRETIHTAAPITPEQWQRAQQQRLQQPTGAQLWGEVAAIRSTPPDAS